MWNIIKRKNERNRSNLFYLDIILCFESAKKHGVIRHAMDNVLFISIIMNKFFPQKWCILCM